MPTLVNTSERERGLLGAVLDGYLPDPSGYAAKALKNAPESFQDLNLGTVAQIIRTLREGGEQVSLLSVRERLQFLGKFEAIGGDSFLSGLANDAMPDAQIEADAKDIWEEYQVRQTLSLFNDGSQALRAGPKQRKAIVEGVCAGLEFLSESESNGLPEITDAANLTADTTPLPAELVQGLLHRGSKLVLGGGSKSFKTWTLLDLAFSVAHGQPWLGFPTEQGRVLYLNFEIQSGFFRERIRTIAHAKCGGVAPGRLDVWNLRGYSTNYATLLPKIIQQVQKAGYALIVLDPIYKLYGGADENSAGDVAELLNGIERLSVDTGAAVAFGAHFSKGNQAGKESIDRISGSGVFARDPDTILVFTKHEQDDAFTVEATLRNFRPVEPFVAQWHFPLFERDDELDPTRLKQAGRKSEHSAKMLLEALPAGGLENKAWEDQCQNTFGISRRTFYRLKKELTDSGKVFLSKVNDKWTPTNKA